jgi:hypothetical protein
MEGVTQQDYEREIAKAEKANDAVRVRLLQAVHSVIAQCKYEDIQTPEDLLGIIEPLRFKMVFLKRMARYQGETDETESSLIAQDERRVFGVINIADAGDEF